ncbi:uncharacterized protein G2W53_004722 [Senna tora]|uniref:Uncharacterized protein n=1 Tax=Senna tora TaxID=362788 RepID=A0A834XCC8_9FABA|nr:uncharacterized protein G2W53_004722 [Senna tora]
MATGDEEIIDIDQNVELNLVMFQGMQGIVRIRLHEPI